MTLEDLKGPGFLYLATPYSRYKRGTFSAFVEACWAAAECLKAGVSVFSPIAHSHPIGSHSALDSQDHEFWLQVVDRPFMEAARGLLVVLMEGWNESRGVREEIEFFAAQGKPIWWLDPETLEIHEAAPQAVL
jgi:nucleoside 2-deoxyribosyltransferase